MRIAVPLFLLLCSACAEYVYVERPAGTGPREAPLTVGQVQGMLEAGVSEGLIREKAELAGVEKLSADDLVALKKAGAGDILLETLVKEEREPVRRAPSSRPTYSYGSYSSSYYGYYGNPYYYYGYPGYWNRGYGCNGCRSHGHYHYYGGSSWSGRSGSKVRFGW